MKRLALLASLGALLVPHGTASSAPTTSLEITSATPTQSGIAIAGKLLLGDDAIGTLQVGTDGSGDAAQGGIGADLGDAFIRTDPTAKRLTFTLKINDGVPGVDGPGPFVGVQWPFAVDDLDNGKWLGAGTAGSGWTGAGPETGKWTDLCATTAGSYSCPAALTGSVTIGQISWTIPFDRPSAPAYDVNYGSRIQGGAAAGGTPRTVPFAIAIPNNALDTVDEYLPYTVPGRVELGIAKAEAAPEYTTAVEFVPTTGAFSGTLPRPAPGSYTVHARSCFGAGEEPACVTTSFPVTV